MKNIILNLLNKKVELNIIGILKNQILFIIFVILFGVLGISIGFESISESISYIQLNYYIITIYLVLKLIAWKFNDIKVIRYLIMILDSLLILGGLICIFTILNNDQKDFISFWNNIYITNIDPNVFKYDQVVNQLINLGITKDQIAIYYDWKVAERGITNLSYNAIIEYSKEMQKEIMEKIAIDLEKEMQESMAKSIVITQESKYTLTEWVLNNKLKILIGGLIIAVSVYAILKGRGGSADSASDGLGGPIDPTIVPSIAPDLFILQANTRMARQITEVCNLIRLRMSMPKAEDNLELFNAKIVNLEQLKVSLENPKIMAYLMNTLEFRVAGRFFTTFFDYCKPKTFDNDAAMLTELNERLQPIIDMLNNL